MPTLESIRRETRGFLGVNLRRDRLSLADAEVARAINGDFHTLLGTIKLRRGRARLFDTALTQETKIRRIARINSIRYYVVGTQLYRQVSDANPPSYIVGSLAAEEVTILEAFRPFNDDTIWAFIADASAMKKDDGTNLRNWGIAAPTVAPLVGLGGGTGLTGTYTYVYTYVRKVGASIAHESNPSPTSAPIVFANQNGFVFVTLPTDPQVTHIRIYRTVANGTQHLLTNEFLSITDNGLDATLDVALGARVETDNDPPTPCGWVAFYNETAFFCRDPDHPNYLWFSKRFRPESVPATNFLEIGNATDPLQCAVPYGGFLGVFTRLTKYGLAGSAASGFVPVEKTRRGTPAPTATLPTDAGIIFVARDGVWLTPLTAGDTNLSSAIEPLFFDQTVNDFAPINWAAINTAAAALYKGRYYLSLPTGMATTPNVMAVYSRQTQQWYFFDHPARSLYHEEEEDRLLAGFTDGRAYALETTLADDGADITLEVEKDEGGASAEEQSLRKLWQWVSLDGDSLGDAVTIKLFVDETLVHTRSAVLTRSRTLYPFPAGSLGFTARVRLEYTGHQEIKVYAIKLIGWPLEAA